MMRSRAAALFALRGMLLCILLLTAACRVAVAAEAEDDGNPHHMMKPDGKTDDEKCAVCHTDDLSLSTSKLETCTTCHDPTLHSGSFEHLQANAETVKAHLPPAKEGEDEFPLAEDGKIYCGTCHFFHDPRVSEEEKPAPVRPLSTSPIASAVREATAAKWPLLAQQHGVAAAGASFLEKSTPALRLPLDDNQLCGHCHGKGGK